MHIIIFDDCYNRGTNHRTFLHDNFNRRKLDAEAANLGLVNIEPRKQEYVITGETDAVAGSIQAASPFISTLVLVNANAACAVRSLHLHEHSDTGIRQGLAHPCNRPAQHRTASSQPDFRIAI